MPAYLQIDDMELQNLSPASWTTVCSHVTRLVMKIGKHLLMKWYSSPLHSILEALLQLGFINSSDTISFCPFCWKFNEQYWQAISVHLLVCQSVFFIYLLFTRLFDIHQAVSLAHAAAIKVENKVTDIYVLL